MLLLFLGKIIEMFDIKIPRTTFLVGPKKQFKNMTDKTRLGTTIVYVLSLVGTLVSAFVLKKAIVVLLFIIVQFLALIWYSLSYIPYARTLVKKCFKSATAENNA